MIDAFGHVFYAIIMIGMFQIGRDRALGWALRFAGDTGWCVLGVMMGMTSIWIWGILFLTIDVIGWRRCRSRGRLAQPPTGDPA